MKITKQRYNQIKNKAEGVTLPKLAKRYGISESTAWKIRNTSDFEDYQGMLYRYGQARKYKNLANEEDIRKANFKIALVGLIIIVIAVVLGIVCG